MKLETLVNERYSRIKKAIETIKSAEASYAKEVHKNFDALDMEAIESLARKRKAKLVLKERLEQFIEKYEHMSW